MSTIIIHTSPTSPYGWTARLVATEKGVPFEVAPADVSAPEYERLHPFRKMPVLRHGEVVVFETLAITHYIDRAFDGPALQPLDCLGQTQVLRWVSVVNSYVFPTMNGLVKERFAMSRHGTAPDEVAIAGMRAPLAKQLRLINDVVSSTLFLVGDQLSIADSFLFPHLHYASFTPEGAEALSAAPSAQRWLDRMRARPSFESTNPLRIS